jgi:hypothetical protein
MRRFAVRINAAIALAIGLAHPVAATPPVDAPVWGAASDEGDEDARSESSAPSISARDSGPGGDLLQQRPALDEASGEVGVVEEAGPPDVEPFELLGRTIEPGERAMLDLELSESFTGGAVATPVQVIHGSNPGRVLCLVAGIHGDEIVGIEIVRRIVEQIDVESLSGTVITMPVANPMGFRQSSRYLPDRRDLNRYFPGRPYGSLASRIAHRIFNNVIKRCDLLVDFHSGSFHRANLPQIRADLNDPKLLELAQWFGSPVVVHSRGGEGTLRRAASDAGIPAVLFEAGEPMRFDEASVQIGVWGASSLLFRLGMYPTEQVEDIEADVFRGNAWVRADAGGIFIADAQLGDWIVAGQVLGTVTNPFTHEKVVVKGTRNGRIIGQALDQVVTPGYALFHIGTLGHSAEATPTEDSSDFSSDGVESEERPE